MHRQGDGFARFESVTLQAQVQTPRLLNALHLVVHADGLHQGLPLLARQAHHHQPHTIGALHVSAKRTKEVVAIALALLPQLRLCNKTQVRHGGESHVFQRQLHMLALAGAQPMTFGREQAQCSHLARHQIPGGQHMVDHVVAVFGTGQKWEPHPGVDGVIHGRPTLAVTLQCQLNEVGATLGQGFIRQPATGRKIGQEHAGHGPWGRDERHGQLSPFRRRQVHHH